MRSSTIAQNPVGGGTLIVPRIGKIGQKYPKVRSSKSPMKKLGIAFMNGDTPVMLVSSLLPWRVAILTPKETPMKTFKRNDVPSSIRVLGRRDSNSPSTGCRVTKDRPKSKVSIFLR